jgi:Phage integrase, N-terminal SAM-like domain
VHKPKLLDRVRSVARVRHPSIRTERAYSDWIRRYILFHKKRHPSEMGEEEVRQFFSHLTVESKVAASTQNVALCALLFLYRDVLGVELPYVGGVLRAKRPVRVPVVFTREEADALCSHLPGTRRPGSRNTAAATRRGTLSPRPCWRTAMTTSGESLNSSSPPGSTGPPAKRRD